MLTTPGLNYLFFVTKLLFARFASLLFESATCCRLPMITRLCSILVCKFAFMTRLSMNCNCLMPFNWYAFTILMLLYHSRTANDHSLLIALNDFYCLNAVETLLEFSPYCIISFVSEEFRYLLMLVITKLVPICPMDTLLLCNYYEIPATINFIFYLGIHSATNPYLSDD